MGMLTGKGKHKAKAGKSSIHKYIKTRKCEERRVQMQDIGNTLQTEQPAT